MKASTSKLLARIAGIGVVLVAIFGLSSVAEAKGRKRVVVLDLEGPKAEKFQSDLVKLLKKSHTVISASKWSDKGGDASPDKDNLKKTAKKLKADGVLVATVSKRRDQYILKVKLYAGASGKVAGEPVFKADGAKIDGDLADDLKTELVGLIDGLDSNRGGGGDDEEDEEEEPKKVAKKSADDEEEDKPKKSGFSKKAKGNEDEEDEKPAKKAAAKASDDEEGTDEDPLPKPKKRPAKSDDDEGEETASSDDGGDDDDGGDVSEDNDDDGTAMSREKALSPGNRAVDAAVGFSFSARRMGFVYQADLPPTSRPPRYRGTPVPGLLFDATIYPLAFGHKSDAMTKNIGLTVHFDQVLLVNSETPGMNGMPGTKLKSSQQRYAVGAVFRYPFNKSATSPVIGGELRYGRQKFTIDGMSGIPNVNYTIIDPSVFFRYPLSTKVVLNVDLGYMLMSDAGAIVTAENYGKASISGFEGELGGDYLITKNIFARAAFRFATIGMNFDGTGMKTNVDGDPEADVVGARDTYLGGMITAGYLY